MKILNAEQMRNIDRRTTERFGVPSIVLMENAAIAVVEAIAAHYPDADRVAIFCGTGANGGDGFAVARHLENRGIVPVILLAGDRNAIKGDALTNLRICERLALPLYELPYGGGALSMVVIAALVLLPEGLAALRAARLNRLQTSMNLALGSALASIGLTIPAVAVVSIVLGQPLALGLGVKEEILLALTLLVGVITLGTGRTTVLQGIVHLVIFAAFLFLAVVP